MPANPGRVEPINWKSVVAEALRRRRAEKLTQKEHAALAGVSIPTMVAFDRGEETVTLAKVFDILRVVGLVLERDSTSVQGAFVSEALTRWRELTNKLPDDSPGRFPNGSYQLDYALEGDLPMFELHKFRDILEKAVVRHTGWPLFLFLIRPELSPYEKDGTIECWLKPSDAPGANRPLGDPAHCDFWRVAPSGRAFIMRGYQEDSQDTFAPGTIFDTTLPVWRMGELLMHAAQLATLLKRDTSHIKVRMRAHYTGLTGRVLRNWGNPSSDLIFEGGAARSDEALLETTVTIPDIKEKLADVLHPLVASLFERFGVSGLSVERVRAEVGRLTANSFTSVRS
jgi:transcriptional regulator with XRE-family HTH domain